MRIFLFFHLFLTLALSACQTNSTLIPNSSLAKKETKPSNSNQRVRYFDRWGDQNCEATLDPKVMAKEDFYTLRDYINYGLRFDEKLAFLKTRDQLKEAKMAATKNKEKLLAFVKNVPALNKGKSKDLGKALVDLANQSEYEQLQVIQFLETWDVKLLWNSETKPEAYVPVKVLPPPSELWTFNGLDCEDKLEILSFDDVRLEAYAKKFGDNRCSGSCATDFYITKEMSPEMRDQKRIHLFLWAWYNNEVCTVPSKNKKKRISASNVETLENMLKDIAGDGLSDYKCEDLEDDCED